jgi:hypothetical protein
MQRRQITLEDGRYLIFYTFDDERAAAPSPSSATERADDDHAAARGAEPKAEPQATEERRV